MKRITFLALLTLTIWASTLSVADALPSYGGDCSVCHTRPVVQDFSIPYTSESLTVPITTFIATDQDTSKPSQAGVRGYLVTETSTMPGASASGWTSSPPGSITFVTTGLKTLYAWVKDITNSVSDDLISAQVDISAPNGAPTAKVGPDQLAYIGHMITLDGSGSSDPNGDPLTYRWSLIAKPAGSAAVLSGATTVSPSFLVDAFGDYIVELVVNDGMADSPPDTVTISIGNNPPLAYAGPDVKVYIVDNTVVPLDGSGSIDPDGDPLIYQWSLVTRPSASQAMLSDPAAVNPTFVVDVPGTYVAQLIVNDGKIESLPDLVTISTENTAPVANAGPGQTAGVGATITLDGSGSSDLDGDPLTYRWSFFSTPSGSTAALSGETTATPTFVADLDGEYIVQLVVNDGRIDSDPSAVQISTRNSPPTADAGPDQQAAVGTLVFLDGSGSSDPDGNPLTFQWSFSAVPDGSAAALSDPADAAPSFTADLVGEYVIQLIVNDGKEGLGADTVGFKAVIEEAPAPDKDKDKKDKDKSKKKKNKKNKHKDKKDRDKEGDDDDDDYRGK